MTNTDPEGTSQASTPIEVNSISPEEELEKKQEEAEPKPPEFGRCVKAFERKKRQNDLLLWRIHDRRRARPPAPPIPANSNGKWAASSKEGFTTSIKVAPVTLEAVNRTKLTCSGESGTGAITGRKTVGSVLLAFTGCESAGQKCTTSGHAEGEIASVGLEGALGADNGSRATKKAKKRCTSGSTCSQWAKSGPLFAYTCGGGEPQTLSGSVIAPRHGRQNADELDAQIQPVGRPAETGGVRRSAPQTCCRSGIGEQVGLSLNALLTTEEAVEINPAF